MVDILASKLFTSSSRKASILAAIQDPNNRELVKQVAEALDDEFIDKKYLEPESSEPEKDVVDDSKDFKPKSARISHPSGPMPHGSGPSSNLGEENLDAEGSEESELPPDDSDTSLERDDEVVDSSKKINASVLLDVVKGTLNSRIDTAGVDRVVEKGEELWVYYSDEINLNKVLSETVQELMLRGYSMLEFNRLARSNNAIVFDIVRSSSGGD